MHPRQTRGGTGGRGASASGSRGGTGDVGAQRTIRRLLKTVEALMQARTLCPSFVLFFSLMLAVIIA